MLSPLSVALTLSIAISWSLVLATATGSEHCSKSTRLAGAKQIIYAYNLVRPGATAQAFQAVPFGQDCHVFIIPNGLAPVPVAIDGTTTYDFAVASRQAFSRVTGKYIDFGDKNRTTIIQTEVTLGLLHAVWLPVTFSANVYLFYSEDCKIVDVTAYATIPSILLGYPVSPPVFGPVNCAKFPLVGCCATGRCGGILS